jgi:hypothetical protein
MILRSMRMHPYRACIFLKIHTYVEKFARIRLKYGKNTPKWHRMSNIRRKMESNPLFIYAGKKAYAEGLLNHTAYSVCMYIHTPTAYDHTTQPYRRVSRVSTDGRSRPIIHSICAILRECCQSHNLPGAENFALKGFCRLFSEALYVRRTLVIMSSANNVILEVLREYVRRREFSCGVS